MLKMERSERQIVKSAMMQGHVIPDKILKRPELILGLDLYLEAFFDLEHDREYGMNLSPIRWSTIRNYCIVNNFDEEQTEKAHYFIRSLDLTYMEIQNKKD